MPHPGPEFDTRDLGLDLSLIQDTSRLQALDPESVLWALYLGHDVRDEAYYIWQSGSPGLRRLIGQIVADFGAVGRLGSSYGGLTIGDALWENARVKSITDRGFPDGSIRSSSDRPTMLSIEWHGLPKEVVAVVVYDGGAAFGWQRPVSGTVAFQFEVNGDDTRSVGRARRRDGRLVQYRRRVEQRLHVLRLDRDETHFMSGLGGHPAPMVRFVASCSASSFEGKPSIHTDTPPSVVK